MSYKDSHKNKLGLVPLNTAVEMRLSSTYIILPNVYYEILRKDAMRLTDEEIRTYLFKRFGLKVARDAIIIRGRVTLTL